MIEKLRTLVWYLARPVFWQHLLALLWRTLNGAARQEDRYPESLAWASGRAVSVADALKVVGLLSPDAALPASFSAERIAEAEARARHSKVEMGGPGDLDMIYLATGLSGAKRVIETGVAYGWSSFAILAALGDKGRLVSVDMPYPKLNNEAFVGIVVPDEWRDRWTLIRRPDRGGLKAAIAAFGGTIDLAHYDSDKSYDGRMFAYPLIWNALRPGGIFISDDVSDNFGFRDWFEREGHAFAVSESGGRYVGIARKPGGGVSP